MDISENIKIIREGRKVKQSDLARSLGIEPTNYPRLEKRGNKLSIEQLNAIADGLGVSLLELITGGKPLNGLNNDGKTISTNQSESAIECSELKKRIKELETLNRANERYIDLVISTLNYHFNSAFHSIAERYDIGELEKIEDEELDRLAMLDSRDLPNGEVVTYDSYERKYKEKDYNEIIDRAFHSDNELYRLLVSISELNVVTEPNPFLNALRRNRKEPFGLVRIYQDRYDSSRSSKSTWDTFRGDTEKKGPQEN